VRLSSLSRRACAGSAERASRADTDALTREFNDAVSFANGDAVADSFIHSFTGADFHAKRGVDPEHDEFR
jgi:hypothetical protein